jgi:hypothetical protein
LEGRGVVIGSDTFVLRDSKIVLQTAHIGFL